MNKNFAKIQLSAEEMRLVRDPEWILTKNSVMGKVIAMFAGLSERTSEGTADTRSASAALGQGSREPKISKGENYKGLPWVMLDYPRVFGREDVAAIRTFFLWGHAFSVTLHLKGIYRERFLPGILARRGDLAAAGFEMGISDDEWAHEHTVETYGSLREGLVLAGDDATREERTRAGARPWLKLSARVDLEHWDEVPERLSRLHSQLMEILSDEGCD